MQIKNIVFDVYKQNVLSSELEELKIFNVKQSEPHDFLILKEKYVK